MDDYGYFGKGSSGYAHYTQAHNRSHGSGGGGGGNRNNGNGSGFKEGLIILLALIILNIFLRACGPMIAEMIYF